MMAEPAQKTPLIAAAFVALILVLAARAQAAEMLPVFAALMALLLALVVASLPVFAVRPPVPLTVLSALLLMPRAAPHRTPALACHRDRRAADNSCARAPGSCSTRIRDL
jgi:hypothetical protein